MGSDYDTFRRLAIGSCLTSGLAIVILAVAAPTLYNHSMTDYYNIESRALVYKDQTNRLWEEMQSLGQDGARTNGIKLPIFSLAAVVPRGLEDLFVRVVRNSAAHKDSPVSQETLEMMVCLVCQEILELLAMMVWMWNCHQKMRCRAPFVREDRLDHEALKVNAVSLGTQECQAMREKWAIRGWMGWPGHPEIMESPGKKGPRVHLAILAKRSSLESASKGPRARLGHRDRKESKERQDGLQKKLEIPEAPVNPVKLDPKEFDCGVSHIIAPMTHAVFNAEAEKPKDQYAGYSVGTGDDKYSNRQLSNHPSGGYRNPIRPLAAVNHHQFPCHQNHIK
ncbi:unnamed protein product, partial [Mesorhabditis spiculigera]